MSGPLGSDVNHLVAQYNASQHTYQVTAVYKGTYPQVLADTVAAFRAHKAPDITQIFDVGTATMMDTRGVYDPVYKLMAKEKIPFATSDFIGGAASYYETANGNLDSLPFNSSTPVLYYNKAMLAAIHAQPPATWQQVGTVGTALRAHGAKCGFSTAWPDWTQFEQYSVWNGYHYATDNNGYGAIKGVKVLINTAPFVSHIAQLAAWQKSGVFEYAGRAGAPAPLFIKGTCGMYIDSSAAYAAIAKGAKFKFGEAPLPYDATAKGAPRNTVVGGASLWVMSSAPQKAQPGIAHFLHFLMSGSAQAYWASKTGYVPVTQAGVAKLTSSGFYKSSPDALVAVHELTNKPATPWTRGIRLGDLSKIRDIENAAITAVFAGKEPAQQALDTAATQANATLAYFASGSAG
ncbi:MAG: extracellular solute-binding protein [Chloroflexota bacterium]